MSCIGNESMETSDHATVLSTLRHPKCLGIYQYHSFILPNPFASFKMGYIQSSLRILCIRSSSHRPYTSPNHNLDDAPSLHIITCHLHNVLSSLHFIPTSSFTLNTHLPTYLSFLWHIIPTTQHNIRYIPICHRYDASFLCGYPYTSSVTHYPTLLIIHHPSSSFNHPSIPMSFYTSSYASSHHHHHHHPHTPCMYSSIILLHIILPMSYHLYTSSSIPMSPSIHILLYILDI